MCVHVHTCKVIDQNVLTEEENKNSYPIHGIAWRRSLAAEHSLVCKALMFLSSLWVKATQNPGIRLLISALMEDDLKPSQLII